MHLSSYKLVTSTCKHRLLTVIKARLKTFSIVLTQVYHAVAWPNLGVAKPRPSQTFGDQYTLIEQSTILKQSPLTMPPTNSLSLATDLYTIVHHKK